MMCEHAASAMTGDMESVGEGDGRRVGGKSVKSGYEKREGKREV